MSDGLPLLGEHQAPSKEDPSTQANAYSPSEEERKTVKLVNKLFTKAKKHREKYDSKWMDWYRMFRGKQWKEERPSYRHSAVINLVFRAIQSQVPIQTDAMPRFEFLPQDPSDYPLAEILNQLAASDWDTKNWLIPLSETLYDANFYGTGFGYMGWDEKAQYGVGDICHESWDPFYCFPDPDAREVNGKRGRYFIYAEPIEVEILKSEYPDKAKFIKADMVELLKDSDKTNVHLTRYRSPADQATIIEGSTGQDEAENTKALLIKCWYSDESVEESEEKEQVEQIQVDPATGEQSTVMVEQIKFTKRKKYPRGRFIKLAGNVVLEDRENEYEDAKVPGAKLVNYMLPREFWGMSEVEQAEGPQMIYNKILSFALDVMTLMGNPIWVVDNDSGVDTDNLFNRPGLIVEKNKGSEVRREEGTQLQPYVLQLAQTIRAGFDEVVGNEDVSRGVRPEGVTAAKAIEALQATAQTRLRQKARFLDAYLQDLGQLYLSRVFQYITVPRIYRLTNNENVSKYFKFHVEPQSDGKKVAKLREFMQNDDGSVAYGDEQAFQIQGEFDVKVATGSSLPFAKDDKMNQARWLFEAGIIDEEEVLKTVDWPNKEAVMSRVEQKKAMMAEQQAMQGSGQVA